MFLFLLSHSFHSSSPAVHQVSLLTMIRPPTTSIGLLLLLIGYAAAGKGAGWGPEEREQGGRGVRRERARGHTAGEAAEQISVWSVKGVVIY